MKSKAVFLALLMIIAGNLFPVHARVITFDEYPSNPAPQDPYTNYYDDPISNEYAGIGVYFLSGPNTPELETIDTLWGGDIFNATNWPNSDFPSPYVVPPKTQYLGLTKDPGVYPDIGVVIEFDYLCRYLKFETRKSGNNTLTYASLRIFFFNTETGSAPVFIAGATAYVCPSNYGIEDDDDWIPYSWGGQGEVPPFNRVLLLSDKKFAIENLTFFDQWDPDLDGDVDGASLVDFILSDPMSKSDAADSLIRIAERFGTVD